MTCPGKLLLKLLRARDNPNTSAERYSTRGWFKSDDQALNCLIQLYKRMSVLNEMYNRLTASGMFIEMPRN